MNRSLYRLTMSCLLALGAAFALGCEAEPEDEADAPPALTEEECPHDWPWTAAQEKNIEAFTGERDEVPEYNDCQRFLLGSMSDPSYGNVFAIFVAASVAEAHGTDGDTPQAPGESVRAPSSDPAAGTSAANGNGMSAVALIAAWDDYRPLGIPRPGFYCLMMDSGSRPNAAIVEAGANADCDNPVMSTRHDLFVFRQPNRPNLPGRPPNEQLTPTDVPGVVRWGFDGVPAAGAAATGNWVQYAIVPCGTAVCYVGPTGPGGSGAGFTPKPPYTILADMSGTLPQKGRTREVDFWHDTQFLADPGSSTGSTNPVVPPLVGVLIPDESLGNRTRQHFEDDWVRVAEVAMSGSAYDSKFNFTATTGDVYNTVDACAYTGSASGSHNCDGLPTNIDSKCQATDPTDPAALKWRARHTSANGTVTYHCIQYIPPSTPGLEVPGTARWKWLADDEALWFRCEDGCCKGVA